ncbi:hypothetical protein QFC20_003713 [Naganishia adeliensis]|uniref:Uncharacterized protein n=1 Tax=Naganishia adeliensis TaxID=92952 RepID=A0ACC2W7Q8_9TREE|nr:hypothetical protein QFC20_003713 [Naganishia adeliensis]
MYIATRSSGHHPDVPTQISSKAGQEAKKAIGLDKDDHEFRVGDQMREYLGEGRRGQVLHIHRGLYVFLYSKDHAENGGIFVTRSKNLEPLDTRPTAGPDLTKQDPSLNQHLPQYVGKQAGNYRHLINTKVVIIKGTNKGIRGLIKDTTGDKARVELETNNKVVPLPFDWLKKRDPVTGALAPLQIYRVGQAVMASDRVDPSQNPYANAGPIAASPGTALGGPTPASGLPWGMTPNPYGGVMGAERLPRDLRMVRHPILMRWAAGHRPSLGERHGASCMAGRVRMQTGVVWSSYSMNRE